MENKTKELIAASDVKDIETVDDFLFDPEELECVEEFKPSDRFKTPFILRALSADEVNEMNQLSMNRVKVNKKGRIINDNALESLDFMVVHSVKSPNLESEKLQNYYGTIGNPAATLRKMLRAGEYTALIAKVNELSGFDINDEVEEAKN